LYKKIKPPLAVATKGNFLKRDNEAPPMAGVTKMTRKNNGSKLIIKEEV
jgi:hypothetical protein